MSQTISIKSVQRDTVLFQILEAHLCGAACQQLTDTLQHLIQVEDKKSAVAFYRDAHLSAKNKKKLLALLNIAEPAKTETPDNTLLAWIEYLAQKNAGYGHLQDFHYLLKQVTPEKKPLNPSLIISILAIISRLSINILYCFRHNLPQAIHAMTKTFNRLPLIALIANTCYILNQTYLFIFYDHIMTPNKRLHTWLSGTLKPLFYLTAYAIKIAQAGITTQLSSSFFIIASFIHFISNLWQFYHLPPALNRPEENANINEKRNYIRQTERTERHLKNSMLNVTCAGFIAGLTIFSCVFPPDILITICIFFIIQLVNLMNTYFHQMLTVSISLIYNQY